MSFREKIEALIENLLEPILSSNSFELVDVEYVKEAGTWYLRVYIDKQGGVTINDCETVSRALDVKLDELDPISDAYILEVSSPGLDRPLKKDKDFDRSIGKQVEVKFYQPENGQKEYSGVLKSYDEQNIMIQTDEETLTFNRKAIAIIRLAVIF